MEEPRWTLDELAERVDAALAVGYAGQSSGRVRAVPDRRAIRWYTTIGLIDRPVAHRGRTALYGPRHLLQLVAVKRLQAKGLPLVAIQQELAGATDAQLARVAHPTPAPAGPLAALAPSGGGPPPTPGAPDTPGPAGARPPASPPRLPPPAPPPWSRPCGVWTSGRERPCCWSRDGSWTRRTCKPSSTPPGRCWPCSGNAGSTVRPAPWAAGPAIGLKTHLSFEG